jgi:glycine C-acetyltransferase
VDLYSGGSSLDMLPSVSIHMSGVSDMDARNMAALRAFGAMREFLRQRLSDRLNQARDNGTLKVIRPIEGPIGAHARMAGAGDTLMFASNDYLALANDAAVVAAAHASLIDGGRMTAQGVIRAVYPHSDMAALEQLLHQNAGAGERFIVTDGVFSMEGDLDRLDHIVAHARQHDATVIVDDAHGIGAVGAGGRGTTAQCGVADAVDILTGSLGKALAGAAGGFIAGPREPIDNVTQFARPQLFSTALPVASVCASRAALRRLVEHPEMVEELSGKTQTFRRLLSDRGLVPIAGATPIVVLMIGDTRRAVAMTGLLAAAGVYAVAFGDPVVPEGKARLRLQVSRAHSAADLERAADLLAQAYRESSPTIV